MSGRPRPPVRASTGAVLLGAAAFLVAACGIPVGEPEALSTEGREDLLFGTSTTTTTSPVDEVDGDLVTQSLYFISSDDKLEVVERAYLENPEINDVLQELEEAPRPEDQEAFAEFDLTLRSVVPVGLDATLLELTEEDEARGVRVLRVSPEGELREELLANPPRARLIVSQLVCTFFGLVSVDTIGVVIEDDTGRLQPTDLDSQPIEGPVVREDFGDCRTGTDERDAIVEEAEEGEAGEEADGGTGDGGTSTTSTTADDGTLDATTSSSTTTTSDP